MAVSVQTVERRVEKSAQAFRTISEVATELDVPQHVLRFWESKFTQVRPLKRGGGRRYYRPEDIDLLRRIRTLLYEDGYTIKGVSAPPQGRARTPAGAASRPGGGKALSRACASSRRGPRRWREAPASRSPDRPAALDHDTARGRSRPPQAARDRVRAGRPRTGADAAAQHPQDAELGLQAWGIAGGRRPRTCSLGVQRPPDPVVLVRKCIKYLILFGFCPGGRIVPGEGPSTESSKGGRDRASESRFCAPSRAFVRAKFI
jgi:DNA-binding transcriptional MerR regulator